MTTPAAAAPPPRGGGKKILGLPAPVAIGGGVAVTVGVGILYKRYKTATAASSATGGTTATPQTTDYSGQPCTDSNGNPGLTDALGNCISSPGAALSSANGSSGTTGSTTTGTGGGGLGQGGGGRRPGQRTSPPSTTGGGGGTTTAPKTMVTVPDVVGLQDNEGIGALVSAGLAWNDTGSPPRHLGATYVIATQSPAGGTQVATGTVITITYQITSGS